VGRLHLRFNLGLRLLILEQKCGLGCETGCLSSDNILQNRKKKVKKKTILVRKVSRVNPSSTGRRMRSHWHIGDDRLLHWWGRWEPHVFLRLGHQVDHAELEGTHSVYVGMWHAAPPIKLCVRV
jgi:hypothetical protein